MIDKNFSKRFTGALAYKTFDFSWNEIKNAAAILLCLNMKQKSFELSWHFFTYESYHKIMYACNVRGEKRVNIITWITGVTRPRSFCWVETNVDAAAVDGNVVYSAGIW